MLIDVHAHLDSETISKDTKKLIQECKKNNVVHIINNGLNFESNENSLKLAKEFEIIEAALGLYPLEAEKINSSNFSKLKSQIVENSNNIIAVGEIGLDGKYGKDSMLQEKNFVELLKLAKEIDKPVIVHSRQAELKVLELLKSNKMEKVVMHSFTGNKKIATEIISNNWFFSIPPAILNSKHFQFLVEITPIENLLTETDSPYQYTNHEPNKPYFVKYSIEMISKIKNANEKKISEQILTNYKRIFL